MAPTLRAVLLGASNVAISFPRLLSFLRETAGGPVEVLGAFGHGRSYGEESRLLWLRHLPGIVRSGLWPELARRQPLPTVALLVPRCDPGWPLGSRLSGGGELGRAMLEIAKCYHPWGGTLWQSFWCGT